MTTTLATKKDAYKATVEIMEVTPEIALSWIGQYPFIGQRKLSSDHVRYLANEMEQDRFTNYTQLRIEEHEGQRFLVNGQHRLHAIVKSGRAAVFTVVLEKVVNIEDVAQVYFREDIGKSRSVDDMMRATNLDQILHIPNHLLNRLGAAVKIISRRFPTHTSKIRISPDDMFGLLTAWSEEAHIFFDLTKNADEQTKWLLHKSSVMAVLLVVLRYSPVKAIEFIKILAENGPLEKYDPCRRLLEALKEIRKTTNRLEAKPQYVSRLTASAWGHFLAGNEIKFLRIPSEITNIVIAMTPFNGSGNIKV